MEASREGRPTHPCVPASSQTLLTVGQASSATQSPRDPALRILYLEEALRHIPRLLGAIDRNPYRPTYGCLDRQYWHYRTSDFPSEMYQEGVLPLALVYANPLPGNRWHQSPRMRELAIAALRFSARSAHRDGSCDDYYPFERALGAAVFSLAAACQAYQTLRLDDDELLAAFKLRARWLMTHDESGRLANHHALAGLALARVGNLTGEAEFHAAAEAKIRSLLTWQSDEGWFDEYGGADPGYQTVTIDCLAKYRALVDAPWLDEPLRRAVAFARLFLHPDHSYGGEYGSRGTYHFYPHGMELLCESNSDAADLADGFLCSLDRQTHASFDDDRLFAHRLGNLIEAYLDWSPRRPLAVEDATSPATIYLPEARLLIDRRRAQTTICSAARGGAFKRFVDEESPVTDAGVVVELSNGTVAVSQSHDFEREATFSQDDAGCSLAVAGPLHVANFETATPLKFAALRLGMWTLGRWCRTWVRRLLQKRVITGRKACPVRHRRLLELAADGSLRVTDTIELLSPRTQVRRLSFGTDCQAAYVAASGIYQESCLQPWTDLEQHVAALNRNRRITIVRRL